MSPENDLACKPASVGRTWFLFHNFFSTSEPPHNDSNIAIPNTMNEPTKENTMDKHQGKRVSFYGIVIYRKVPYLQPEEILNAWYLPKYFVAATEYERVIRNYISQDKHLHLKNEDNMCALGLRTENEKRTEFRAIRASIRAVLTEQDEQFFEATQNDDDAAFNLNDQKISSIYSLYAQESSRQALSRGLHHARNVKDIASAPAPLSPVISVGSSKTRTNPASTLQEPTRKPPRISCTSAAA
jgi:hypothetical protein